MGDQVEECFVSIILTRSCWDVHGFSYLEVPCYFSRLCSCCSCNKFWSESSRNRNSTTTAPRRRTIINQQSKKLIYNQNTRRFYKSRKKKKARLVTQRADGRCFFSFSGKVSGFQPGQNDHWKDPGVPSVVITSHPGFSKGCLLEV